MIRAMFAWALIISYVGLVVCDFRLGQWKTAVLGTLFTIANFLIFFVKD